ncbi:STM2901 family protein [Hafnia psychrotolerans]|uniref:Membrane protein n=1 Tax=Hafnia psychrotolerans TaxID=1477018 RepID=A0ABQ1GCC7_9GAMM|nr:hypothetical protein [Hafnia psychrotolerans]GGA40968.1 membrane protein [Hafnia psychrotolerans]
MDTVEQLDGTYFYAGQSNLSAGELFFMIFCERFANQLGLGAEGFVAIVAIFSGRSNLPTRAKPIGAKKGTSYASKASRAVFKETKFPFGLRLPSVIGGYPPSTLRIKMVAKMGTFTGRAIPAIGWILIANDASQIIYGSIRDYNLIANEKDRLW